MERLVFYPGLRIAQLTFFEYDECAENPYFGRYFGDTAVSKAKDGRTFYTFNDHKIYEVGFPVGEDAAFYVFIQGERHYFKTLRQAQIYIESVLPSSEK